MNDDKKEKNNIEDKVKKEEKNKVKEKEAEDNKEGIMEKIISKLNEKFIHSKKITVISISLVISMILTFIFNVKWSVMGNRLFTDGDGIVSLIAIFAINYTAMNIIYLKKHLKEDKKSLKRFKITSFLAALIIATLFIIGIISENIFINHAVSITKKFIIYILIQYLAYIYLIWDIVKIAFYGLEKIEKRNKDNQNKLIEEIEEKTNKKKKIIEKIKNINLFDGSLKSFFIISALLFISWIPTLLARYPGAFSTDNFEQLIQYYSGAYYNAHPILHSLYLIGVVNLGNTLFGSHTQGIALYSVLQMIFISLTLAYTIKVFSKKRFPKIFSVLILAFGMLYQPIAHHTMIAHKDILCTVVLIHLILQLMEMSENIKKFFSSKKNIFKLALFVLLPLYLRHNVYYAYLIALPLILGLIFFNIKEKEKWKYILIVFSIFTLSMVFYKTSVDYVVKKYQIISGSKREFYSVPSQMLGRLAYFKKEDLTEEEKEMITYWFKKDEVPTVDKVAELYLAQFSDPLKNRISLEVVDTKEGNKKAINDFLKLFKKYKVEMTMGALVHSNLYYFPYKPIHLPQIQVSNAHHPHQDKYAKMINAKLKRVIDKSGKIEKFTNKIYLDEVPVLSIFVNIGYTVYIIIITMMYMIYKKRWMRLIVFMPLLGIYLSCIVSPVGGEIRYFLPVYIGLLIGLPYATYAPNNKENKLLM